MRYLVLLLILYSGGASAVEFKLENSRADDILMHTATALIIIDWGLSLDIENHQDIYESNTIVGKEASRRNINLFSIGKLLLHYYANTTKNRNYWNLTTSIVTGYGVANNISLGLKFNF